MLANRTRKCVIKSDTRQLRHRYVPITSPVQTDLLAIVRHELRPTPIKPPSPEGAAQNRVDFEAALRHRPGDPGPSLAM